MGVQFIASTFGGGWALPNDDDGADALASFFGEDAYPIAPLGGLLGFIVEPYQVDELREEITLDE